MRGEKGQAALEMAILGSIVLFIFSVLVSYGQRFETQHELKMESFRRALQKAYNKNTSITYVMKRDLRPVTLFGGFGRGQAQSLAASSSVMWQKGVAGLKGASPKGQDAAFAYYALNDVEMELDRQSKPTINMDGSRQDVMVPRSVSKEERTRNEVYALDTTKDENFAGITTTRTAKLQDTIHTKVITRFDRHVNKSPWGSTDPNPPVYTDAHGVSSEGVVGLSATPQADGSYKELIGAGGAETARFAAYRHTDPVNGPVESTATNRIYYKRDTTGNAPAVVLTNTTVTSN